MYERSLAIRERALGPEHPDVAQSLKNLANFHVAQVNAHERQHVLWMFYTWCARGPRRWMRCPRIHLLKSASQQELIFCQVKGPVPSPEPLTPMPGWICGNPATQSLTGQVHGGTPSVGEVPLDPREEAWGETPRHSQHSDWPGNGAKKG